MTRQELDTMKKSELLFLARQIGMNGFSRFTKSELIENILSFVAKGGELIEKKFNDLMGKSKKSGILRSRMKQEPQDEISNSTKPSTTGSVIPDENDSPKTSKRRVSSKAGKGNKEPQSTIDREASAREEVEKLRYSGTPLHARGQLITPEMLREIDKDLPDLPMGYGDGTIHLMPRDPRWLFCYWDISEDTRAHSGKYSGGRLFLRLHDVTHIKFDGTNSWSVHQFELNEEARWWYIPVPSEGRHFLAELGYLLPGGKWNSLGNTDPVVPPPGSKSPWVHDVFITLPFEEPLPVNFEASQTNWLGKELPPRDSRPEMPRFGTPMEPDPYFAVGMEESSSSPQSISSWVEMKDEKKLLTVFPLKIDADLRVYGRTLPEAKLEINGSEKRLEKDGSFSFSLSFPDGVQRHTFKATGPSGEIRTVTLTFQRHTNQ
ncbi:MAG: DUF4912 domain-containing protein [Deltaproteobacteria bacterium]|nr:DUF4912 domain-containing protein [Deltaproteobacteria bacterium]